MSPELRIYDSLRREKVPFEPLVPGKVSMYVCGPTPYDSAHIGHVYSAVCFDMIRRSLIWLGYDVTYVRNITDVNDKITRRAAERGQQPDELARHYAAEYNADMIRFGVLPPDIEPWVSTHIDAIIDLVQRLIDSGAAYPVDGDVYFSVAAFPPYGRLSGQSIDELKAGARVEVDERKRAPGDFALWKAATPEEPSWDAPWGAGRPGWHIECSAMGLRHLGETFDIHGGGKDLIFPHHENEIAQSQAALGEGSFARYWMHNGFLNFSGEKMSKSIGNVFGCDQIAAAVDPEALRYFFFKHHYRSPIQFEAVTDQDGAVIFKDLEAAERRLEYFYSTLRRLGDFLSTGKDPGDGEVVPAAEALVPAVRAGLLDDFNTPLALAALGDAAKAANKLLDEPKSAPKPVRRRSLMRLYADIQSVGRALGLLAHEPAEFLAERRTRQAARRGLDTAAVEALLEQRTQARRDKDFSRADELRAALHDLGVEVLDTPQGVDWKLLD
ncbi:MAG: cysteine--tRNA ligase [Haliangiales bacterium]